jgi:hypothetical protein
MLSNRRAELPEQQHAARRFLQTSIARATDKHAGSDGSYFGTFTVTSIAA